jgi:hypothetical protein
MVRDHGLDEHGLGHAMHVQRDLTRLVGYVDRERALPELALNKR